MTLLRPHQREEMLTEKNILENKLKNPYIQDKGVVGTQLRKLNKQLENQTPVSFKDTEIDSKVKREKELREKLLVGMPSQEEMRKAPPGAIGKHMAWEKRNKKNLQEWKETRLRLEPDSMDPDIANFERFRPTRSSLNMDNAQIPGKQYYLPTEAYKQNYDNIEWGAEKDTTIEVLPEAAPEKKGWSEERRKKHSEAMKARHKARKEAE
jgi:hypothetical protein